MPPRRPRLTVAQVLAWADAHHTRTGKWPTARTGPVKGAPGEDWRRLDHSLRKGLRGLEGGNSLARLLDRQRGVRNRLDAPLTEALILAWADRHRAGTGRWPTQVSGPVEGQSRETWRGIDGALRRGCRGLPGGDSLSRLLCRCRGARQGQDGDRRAAAVTTGGDATRRQ